MTGRGVGLVLRWGALCAVALLVPLYAQAPPATVPTFNQHVAPILHAACADCHRPGGIAPMSLLTFDAAAPYAAAIGKAVGDRVMPPWYADPAFGRFKNARGLTAAQIDTIARWVDGGAPEGGGPIPFARVTDVEGWRMPRAPDLVLNLPFEEYVLPTSGEVPTFSVWMKLPLRQERFVQAIEIRPSLQGVVHHSSLSLATLPPGTRIGKAPVFDGGPTLEGVPVYSDNRPFRAASGEEFGTPIMFYVPGGGLLRFPEGVAKRFRPDDYLAWGLHLVSPGRAERLRVEIGIWYARREPHHEVQTWTVNETLEMDGRVIPRDARGERRLPDIPPRAANVAMTGTLPVRQDVTLYSLWPHMHYRGKDMKFVLTEPNGRQTTLLSVPKYNPHWQITYELEKPLKIRRGSTLTAYGHYDNSDANPHNPNPHAPVKFGPQGSDEMFIPFLEVTVDERDLRFDRMRDVLR